MIRRRPDGTKTVLHTFKDGHIPDGFKIDAAGNFWVTTVTSGGIDIVSRDGVPMDFLELDAVPLNCIFDGTSLYVTDFGQAETTGGPLMVGRLLRVQVDVRGMALFTGAIV
jgi:sugar lactone lactonase YvrE